MRRALVTGGGGFVGRAIVHRLRIDGWKVSVLGRRPDADVVADLATNPPALPASPYDLVVHAAGRAHTVPATEAERQAFWTVNEGGTLHLLKALDAAPPGALVLLSTVAVYGRESGEGLKETDPTEASDPYGASKVASERLVNEWTARWGVDAAILRLPLVVGPCPPGNLGAMLRAMRSGRYVGIADGSAKRSVVLASDVAEVVLRAAEVGGIYNLSDGVHPSFSEIERAMASLIGRSAPRRLPLSVADLGGRIGDVVHSLSGWCPPLTSRTVTKMTSSLTLDDVKARTHLGWLPRPVLSEIDTWGRPCPPPLA